MYNTCSERSTTATTKNTKNADGNSNKHIKNEKIIAIDEAQFLDEKLYEVCKKLIEDGIDIILN